MSKGPILISGAGPSGLVLALALRKNGVDVRIIDKEPAPRLGERGAGVSPRSLELHKILGTSDDINTAGGPLLLRREYDPLDGHRAVKTFAMIPVHEPAVGIPFPNAIMLGQNHHERILREHLGKAGTEVEFGSELRSFTQSADSVSVEIVRHIDGEEVVEKSEVAWLVGTDGARSVVRKTLGLPFLGETKHDHETVIGDVRMKGEPREFWERWGDPTSKIVFTRPSSQDPDILNLLIAGKIDAAKLVATPNSMIDQFYEISGRHDIVLEEVIWISQYRPNIRMVDRLRVGRVFIAGDAAHCHSPTGGQGLNSSIQDSFNLGWKLALVQKGFAPPLLLDTYAEERLPIIAEMLNKTTELRKHVVVGISGTDEEANIRKDMTQLGVNYRGSSIVFEEKPDPTVVKSAGYNKVSEMAALPGDRAPEAPGLIDTGSANSKTNLFGLLSPSHHTVLVFSDGEGGNATLQSVTEVIRRQPENTAWGVLVISSPGVTSRDAVAAAANGLFDKVLIDGEGNAYAGYNVRAEEGTTVVIVRPDGVVGARVQSALGIEHYFRGIFNPSLPK